MKHFDKHKIFCDNQHGFRKKCSCETQLLSTVQEIVSSTAKEKQVDVILLDFEKAHGATGLSAVCDCGIS